MKDLSYQTWLNEIKHWKITRKTKIIGKQIIILNKVDSTNNYLKKRIKEPHGTVVIAYQQTAGRGQKLRKWISRPGGLYLTLKLSFDNSVKVKPFWIIAGVSLGMCSTISSMGLNPIIKWPNDIIINNKKVAGILGEFVHGSNSLDAFIGIGVNINNSETEIHQEYPKLLGKITSLKTEKRSNLPLSFILEKFLSHVEEQLLSDRPFNDKVLKQKWINSAQILNKKVSIVDPDTKEVTTGNIIDITIDGSLIVKISSDKFKEVTIGEIHLLI